MRDLRNPASPALLPRGRRRDLHHLLRHRTRSHGDLPAGLRIPAGGPQARQAGAARRREVPNRDIRVPEKFLEDHEGLLAVPGAGVARAALEHPERWIAMCGMPWTALIRTYRTLESGVYYETVPENPVAASVYRAVQRASRSSAKQETAELGRPGRGMPTCWPAGVSAALGSGPQQRPPPRPGISRCACGGSTRSAGGCRRPPPRR